MLEHDGQNLEQALSKTEADAGDTLKAADAVDMQGFMTRSRCLRGQALCRSRVPIAIGTQTSERLNDELE
jgi:hypothetical protein